MMHQRMRYVVKGKKLKRGVVFILFFALSAFTAGGSAQAQSVPDALPSFGAAEPSASSALRLIGTIEGPQAFAGAVLVDSTGNQTFYRLKETLPDGSRIVKVESDSISLKHSDGTTSELYIIHDLKPSPTQPRPASAPPPAATPAVPSPEYSAPARRRPDIAPDRNPGVGMDPAAAAHQGRGRFGAPDSAGGDQNQGAVRGPKQRGSRQRSRDQ